MGKTTLALNLVRNISLYSQAPVLYGAYDLPPEALLLRLPASMCDVESGRQWIGSRLCQHSLQAARRLGFRALQLNLVVSTNTAGIRCWQRNGFQVVGTLPGAFRHRQLGYVDALVMTQSLVEGPIP